MTEQQKSHQSFMMYGGENPLAILFTKGFIKGGLVDTSRRVFKIKKEAPTWWVPGRV